MNDEILIRAPQHNDPFTDKCTPKSENDQTVAILEINNLSIPLSLNRLNNLIDKVNQFSNTIFCYKCDNFIMSRSGWNYGGSCKYQAEKAGIIITDKSAGCEYCVDCTYTCPNAIPRKVNNNLVNV